MRLSYLIIIMLPILYFFNLIPVWVLLLSVIPVLIYERGFGLHQSQLIIRLMITILLLAVISPIVLNTTINAKIPINMTTTAITQVTSIFIVLLPVILLVSVIFHFISYFREDYYDDTGRVHIGERTFRNYSYNYVTEQAKFEKDILDMDKIFRNET